MDTRTAKEAASYSKGAFKYKQDDPRRYKWYGLTKEMISEVNNDIVGLIPGSASSVLEVGCGGGHLAKLIKEKKPRIKYKGIDIVEQNVRDSQHLVPDLEFSVDNYWKALQEKHEFVISYGTLFTTTDQKYIRLLFDLLNASAKKGFIIISLRGVLGISAKILAEKMQEAINTSIRLHNYYYKGKRTFLNGEGITKARNHPFFLWRENTIATMPDLPKKLITDRFVIY